MSRSSRAVVALTSSLLIGSCGGDEPDKLSRELRLSSGDERVFEAYERTATTTQTRVDLAPGTRHVRVRIQCVDARGTVSVDVLDASAQMPCTEDSPSSSVIGLEWRQGLDGSAPAPVRVRAPKGAVWTVVLDAGPGGIDPRG